MDAAVELASQGHKVHVFTAHHDKSRCFEETVAGESHCIFVGLIALLFVPSIILTLILAECLMYQCMKCKIRSAKRTKIEF